MIAILFYFIFKRRKSIDLDYENDHEDVGSNLNRYWKFHEIDYVFILIFLRYRILYWSFSY